MSRRPDKDGRVLRFDLQIGRRVFDSFDFEGFQVLGFWSLAQPFPRLADLPGKLADRDLVLLTNATFREFGEEVREPYNGLVRRAESQRAHSTPRLRCERFMVASPIEPWAGRVTTEVEVTP